MNDKRSRCIARMTRTCVGAAAIIIAVSIYWLLWQTRPTVVPSNADGLRPRVAGFIAQRVPVRRQWSGFGTVEAVDSADVSARVIATVQRITDGTLAGRPVSPGQVLVELDESDFQRQVEMSQEAVRELAAALDLIELEHERLQQQLLLEQENVRISIAERDRVDGLFKRGAASQQGLDLARRLAISAERDLIQLVELIDRISPRKIQSQAQLGGQRARLRRAEQDLQRCRVRSPIGGILQDVDVEVGEELRPGMRLARVVNLERIEVPLRLPALARSDLAVGDEALLSASSDPSRCWQASVVRIAPEDDLLTRTVTVFVEVNQKHLAAQFGSGDGSGLLAPGSFVSGIIRSHRAKERWLVPRRAVRSGRILRVDAGMVVSQPVDVDFVIEGDFVQFGLPDDQWAVLKEDDALELRKGQTLLVNGAAAVLDGDKVEVVLVEVSDSRPPHRIGLDDEADVSSSHGQADRSIIP